MKVKKLNESIEILKENAYLPPIQLDDNKSGWDILTAIGSWDIDRYSYRLPPEKADALQKFLDNYRTTHHALDSVMDLLGDIFSVMAKESDMDDIDKMCWQTYLLIRYANIACEKIKKLIPQELAHYESKNNLSGEQK